MNWEERQEKLQAIYERFEKDVSPFKKDAVCHLGCTFCCTDVGSVDINTLEALTIQQRLETFSRFLKKGLKKKLETNRKKKQKQSAVRCAFLAQHGACLIYDVRPFSCRQLYSLKKCGTQGPTVHRQAVELARSTIARIQAIDDTGYSGHLSYILHMLGSEKFRQVYQSGEFKPDEIMLFGKSHHIVINRMAGQHQVKVV
jgi:Fe-S-cluster containining protein